MTKVLPTNAARPVTVFAPDWSKSNPYQQRLRDSLEAAGISIVFKDFPSNWLPLSKLRSSESHVAVIHIHWIPALVGPVIWSRSKLRQTAKLFLLALDLALVRLSGTRTVWTVHNLIEHESANPLVERLARRVIALLCNHIIVHSESAKRAVQKYYDLDISSKTSVIRHGNYDGIYLPHPDRSAQVSKRIDLDDNHVSILFFGHIRRYKGVERLIEVFRKTSKSNLRLILAGKPYDDIAASIRRQCATDSRIIPTLEFIPNNDVDAYFSLADVVIIPFEKTLSSGSAVLAMTFGKALILPIHAKVLDLADERGAFYFASDEELFKLLQNLDKTQLKNMGRHNRKVANTFSWETIAQATIRAYSV